MENCARRLLWLIGVLAACQLARAGGLVDVPLKETALDPEEVAFFENHVRPVLVTHCYECHSAEAKTLKGGLRLDSRAGWERGGDHGPAVVPGAPEKSLLMQAVDYVHEDLAMPPKQRLPKLTRDRLRQWIERGAADPREEEGALAAGTEQHAAEVDPRSHWAFQPVQKPLAPAEGASWAWGPVDRFIEHQHSQQGLAPAGDADTHTRWRRLYVTLTGLPPTGEDITALEEHETKQAPVSNRWERLADRLLASPRFGEHWGRHWLDVTRFAESSGGGRSLMFKNAWHFRDYAIDAFNADVPYDDLIEEHLAGDLLFREGALEAPRQRERLIGSGFLALGPTNYELQDKELLRMEVVDEQIDTVGRTFMGMTLGCARCHDHKFDPISTEEYYSLAGIFLSTKTLTPGNVSGYVETPLPGPGYQRRQDYERQLEKLKGDLELAKKRDKAEARKVAKALEALKKAAPPELAKAMSVREESENVIGDSHVRIRGAVRSLGSKVSRGFLEAATPEGHAVTPVLGKRESGRRALAEWMTHPEHPLTARVYVNRVWHHVMGEGLVRTVDNFGVTGEAPVHGALLDALAHWFPREGAWSTKRLIRELVLSRTFQLDSRKATEGDPENRLWTRAPSRALTAESLRDTLLQVSGELDLAMGGLTIRKFSAYDNGYEFGHFVRRTVYAPAFRNARLEILDVFDAANPNMVQGKRKRTTLATQALYLMNDPFVMERAARYAARLQSGPGAVQERIGQAYREVLGRPPEDTERALATQFLEEFTASQGWTMLVHSLLASLDFRTLH